MFKRSQSRRDFLYSLGLGSAALYLPVFPSLLPRAFGQTVTGRPLRIVFIGSTNGQKQAVFYPKDTTPMTQYQPNIFYTKLSDISGDISPVFGSAFNSLRNKVSIVRGLDVVTGVPNHNRGGFLACVQDQAGEGSPPKFGASVDWILQQSTNFYKAAPAVQALRHNVYSYEFSFSNIGGKVASLPYVSTDSGLFNQAFSSLGGGGGGGGGTNTSVLRGLAADKVIQRLQSLESNSRMSTFDRQRMIDHNSRLAGLKASYAAASAPRACEKPAQSNEATRRRIFNNVNDTIVAAFNCDLTRIACYSLEDYDDLKTDYQYQHDQVSHENSPADVAASATMNKWKAERVADLITKLDSVVEADGSTLLDNTLVIWGNENGASYIAHRPESQPIVIAGGKNIKFKFGYYVDYRTRPFKYYANRGDFPATGRPYNQFLASVMLAMGLQRSEFEIFGQNGKFGEFSFGEYYNKEYDMYKTNYTDNLPFLYLG